MKQISKRLENSLARIRRCGGIVLIHHTSTGSVDFMLSDGREVAPPRHKQVARGRRSDLWRGRSIRGPRANPSRGERMSQLEKNLEAQIAAINSRIMGAKQTERRALQNQRTDLEIKLEKVRSWA